jgi:hypothetical protein
MNARRLVALPAATLLIFVFGTQTHAAFTFTTPDLPLPAKPGTGLAGTIWADNGNAGGLSGVNDLAAARTVVNTFDPDATFHASQVDYPNGAPNVVTVPGTDFNTLLGVDAPSLSPASIGTQDILNSVMQFVGFYRADAANETASFTLGSDDGSELIIQGTQVLNNDGLHAFPGGGAGPETVTFTTPGLYAIQILFFESQPVEYGIEFADGSTPVPQSRLYRDVPVPATIALIGFGLLGIGFHYRQGSKS